MVENQKYEYGVGLQWYEVYTEYHGDFKIAVII